MAEKRLRAEVTEDTYGVFARVEPTEFRSDEIATAMRISEQLRGGGRRPELVSDREGTFVYLFVGDAPEAAYEEVADAMLEASSWEE